MEGASRGRWISISSLLLFFSIAYLIFSTAIPTRLSSPLTSSSTHSFHAPSHNVWAQLTPAEVDELSKWENDLRLVQLLQPNKTDVIRYLDNDGCLPLRWARLVVNERTEAQMRLAEYMVGPLGLSHGQPVAAYPLTYCYNSGKNYLDRPAIRDITAITFLLEVARNISDITMDLLGGKMGSINGDDPDSLIFAKRTVEQNKGNMTSWLEFLRPGGRVGEWSLLAQGLYVKAEGRVDERSDGFRVMQWGYNGILYDSEEDFRTAWKSPEFVKLPRNLPGQWTETEDFDANPPGRYQPPPVMIQPQGPRYQLDISEGYLSWMGFTFFSSSSAFAGLSFYDVRFNDSRIIYSLELQEVLSQYADSDPARGGMYWFDAVFGMGFSQYELIPGYDCPMYADFVDTTYQIDNANITIKNSICIFEYTADHPISRHSTPWSSTVTRNTYLTLRTVSTVGNYDYMIDFVFYLDGSIEVKYRASGFIMASFFPPFSHVWKASESSSAHSPASTQENEYGYRIHDAISSTIHTHILAFRADLDIGGTANTLVRSKLEPITRSYAWDQPQNPVRNTMHLTTSTVETETALNWPANAQESYIILNNASLNAWGEKRGYKIIPGTLPGSPVHLAIHNCTSLLNSARWAESDLFVLRQHDEELASSNPLSFLAPQDPMIDFAAMLDDELTVQEDLVVYFNLGNHHVPTTQDVPNTLMHTSGSGVMFVPVNYFDRDVSRETAGGVRIDLPLPGDGDGNGGGKGGERVVRRFGGHYEPGKGLEPDLSGARTEEGDGGVVVVGEDRGFGQELSGLMGMQRMIGRGWMGWMGWMGW